MIQYMQYGFWVANAVRLSTSISSAKAGFGVKIRYHLMLLHYNDVISGAITPEIPSLTFVHSTVYSGADHRKYQSSASLAFVRGIHRRSINSSYEWLLTRKMFPFDDVIMLNRLSYETYSWKSPDWRSDDLVWISLRISLKFVLEFRINNIPELVQMMAWRWPGDKPSSEPMVVSLLTHRCVTRPQWI